MKNRKTFIFVLALALAVVDQFSKYIALEYFNNSVSFNDGIAFSIDVPYEILAIGTAILLVAIIYLVGKNEKKLSTATSIAAALLIGGGIGNLIDRVNLGHVIDFISIWIYPTFNLADAFITAGVIIFILFYREKSL